MLFLLMILKMETLLLQEAPLLALLQLNKNGKSIALNGAAAVAMDGLVKQNAAIL